MSEIADSEDVRNAYIVTRQEHDGWSFEYAAAAYDAWFAEMTQG